MEREKERGERERERREREASSLNSYHVDDWQIVYHNDNNFLTR